MRSVFLVLALTVTAWAQPAGKQADVDQIFSAFNTRTPGCAVGVAHQGKIVLKAGYGMADLERNVAITADTVFESGSVAKQFTAAALLLLEQQGKISLDDPMRKYLPELPDYSSPATIRQMIGHTSGLREWRPIATYGGVPEGTYVYDNEDLLRFAAKQRELNFAPGTAFSYTNTGYNLAAILTDRALGDGTTFQEFTHKYIFEPLGMKDTRWRDNIRAVVPNRALAYERRDGELVQHTPIENIIGAGGLLTTVSDLLAWTENFRHAKVGGPEFVKGQQTPVILTDGTAVPYGAAVMLNQPGGVREVAHRGFTGGYRTWLGFYPDHAVSVAVLCNYGIVKPEPMGRATARLWTGAQAPVPPVSGYTPPAGALEQLTGRYRRGHNNTVVELSIADGNLVIDKQTILWPLRAGVFAGAFADAGLSSYLEYHVEQTTPMRLRIVAPLGGDMFLERVTPVEPSAKDLAALLGKYESEETESVIAIALGKKPGALTYRVGGNKSIPLEPAYKDVFTGPNREAFRFYRDAMGEVTSLGIGEPDVWDLRFLRVR